MTADVKRLGEVAYREELPAGAGDEAPAVLFVHGYPQSSYMWRHLLPAIAAAGWRAIAPDMPGFGNSPPLRSSTWDRQVEELERFRRGLGLDRVALVVHDWGGLIGLRWACEHPDALRGLVISCTNFFPDWEFHSLARALRTEGKGEHVLSRVTREQLASQLGEMSDRIGPDAIEEYYKAYADEDRRRAQLELWRSLDLERLVPYQRPFAELDVPVLIFWGERDAFATVDIAHRFHSVLPSSMLTIVPGAGHFVFEDEPDRAAQEISAFLTGRLQ
jgi:haloalkane dehalogenase